VRQGLEERGVQTQIHYPIAPYRQPACRHLGIEPAELPITERLQQEVLSLPIGPHLSHDQLDYTLQALNDVLSGIGGIARD
jgi:dTDP-4-amino-4,6-dideoxygalactose transaminase